MIRIVDIDCKALNAITHSGFFHGDEVLATAVLERALGELHLARVNTVPESLRSDVIVYDIGHGRYDHHQSGGNGIRENGVPYSSVGLIWKDFGMKALGGSDAAKVAWDYIDRLIIQGVDEVDNGLFISDEQSARQLTFPKTIALFNPQMGSGLSYDEAFLEAVSYTGKVLDKAIAKYLTLAAAQPVVDQAIAESEVHVAVLEERIPWQELILDSVNPKANEVYFVVMPSEREGYIWQAVPDYLGSYGLRKQAPASWRGLSGDELKKVTGIEAALFCHQSGFAGVAETRDDAIRMARIAALSYEGLAPDIQSVRIPNGEAITKTGDR